MTNRCIYRSLFSRSFEWSDVVLLRVDCQRNRKNLTIRNIQYNTGRFFFVFGKIFFFFKCVISGSYNFGREHVVNLYRLR